MKFSVACLLAAVGLTIIGGVSGRARIVGGQFAEDEQFPYQVALFENGQFMCGGSIIDDRWILTAAHCVLEMDGSHVTNMTVLAGTPHLNRGGVLFDPAAIYAHESYASFQNDIALIKLNETIEYDATMQPIELYDGEELAENSTVVISGHGRIGTGQPISELLKYNTMLVEEHERCEFEGLICFNEEVDNGACNGDSGGPAVFEGRQVGVANFVIGGCGTENPDGYAKVAYYLDWIQRTKREAVEA